MKILHTSDWHLGRTLYGKKRHAEFEAFLLWLAETVQCEAIDVLLVAGDVFDSSAPSNRAQELYYRFLCRVAASTCRHVVLIAGNHDSPSFLNAPKELLKALDVHVVGNPTADPADEVLVLNNGAGMPELIVCAVPYLRDGDIRVAQAGESADDKQEKLIAGIRAHYAAVADRAVARRDQLGADIPIVAMGHLFTAGGQCVEGDGVRELYIGSLAHVPSAIFPDCFDYVALGHLHVPQKVGGLETIRYSGSPLPMGFGEAKQQKSLCLVTFAQGSGRETASVRLLEIPLWQRLERIRGDWQSIHSRLRELLTTDSQCWLEVVYEGAEVMTGLRTRLDATLAAHTGKSDSAVDILRIKNTRVIERALGQSHSGETLDELDESEVFQRCLSAHQVPEEQRPELLRTYGETLFSLQEDGLPERGA